MKEATAIRPEFVCAEIVCTGDVALVGVAVDNRQDKTNEFQDVKRTYAPGAAFSPYLTRSFPSRFSKGDIVDSGGGVAPSTASSEQ